MESLFGNKLEYYGSEYEIAIQLGIITKSEAIQHKFNCYRFVENTLEGEDPVNSYLKYLRLLSGNLSPTTFKLHQLWNLNQAVVKDWLNIVCRVYPKVRTLVLYGISNAGKSLLAQALLRPLAPAMIQRDGGMNVHWLENLHQKSIILWEEPSIHMSNIEDCKLIFGGERLILNRKNKNLIDRPPGPAVVVTTNNRFWEYGSESALRNRMHIYDFHKPVESVITERLNIEDVLTYLCYLIDEPERFH